MPINRLSLMDRQDLVRQLLRLSLSSLILLGSKDLVLLMLMLLLLLKLVKVVLVVLMLLVLSC